MNCEQRLIWARELVTQLEAGNQVKAEALISELADSRESELFQEVGRLTRELHEAINSFLLTAEMSTIAHIDIPDASERLNYVITMTEKSANDSLSAVEAGLPLADKLMSQAKEITRQLDSAGIVASDVEGLTVLSDDLRVFLGLVETNSGKLHKKLSEIMVAQGFQDLTGQIIRRVIGLVQEVEERLVQLVRISGVKPPVKAEEKGKLEGPVIPGLDQGDVMESQDDVDDLLSSLGF